MKNKMKMDGICVWIKNNIIGIIGIIIQLGSGYGIKEYINGNLSKTELSLIIIIIIETGYILVHWLYNKMSFRSYYYPISKINYNYDVLRHDIYYTMTSSNVLKFSQEITLKSKVNNLESVLKKYIWTGNEKPKVPIAELNVREIVITNRIGIWNYFRLILNETVPKGEITTIGYRFPDIENCESSSAFFSTSTEEPTKELVLHLNLGKKYGNFPIIKEEFRAIESDNAIFSEKDKLDENGKYIWDIQKVKRFRYYRLRWDWNANAGVDSVPMLDE